MESKYSIRLRNTLELLDIKQAELARRTGITEATISNYINAKKIPQLSVVEKIADVLNVSVDYLLGRSNNLRKSNSDDFFDVSDLNPADLNDIKIYIDFLKFKNKIKNKR